MTTSNPMAYEDDTDTVRETIVSKTVDGTQEFYHLGKYAHNWVVFPSTQLHPKQLQALVAAEKKGGHSDAWKDVEHTDWNTIRNLLNTGRWSSFFPVLKKPDGKPYPRPQRNFKILKFFMAGFKFDSNMALRELPKEPFWFRFSWLFFMFYISNSIEKVMLQCIESEKELRERVINMYPNIAIPSALIAGISLGSYFNGFSSNEVVNTVFGFCTLASGACGIFSTFTGTGYLLILLAIPEHATDEFLMANLCFLGIPIFTMFCCLFWLALAIVVIANPLYNAVVLTLIILMAGPMSSIVIWAILCFLDSTLVTAYDSLVEAQDHRDNHDINEYGITIVSMDADKPFTIRKKEEMKKDVDGANNGANDRDNDGELVREIGKLSKLRSSGILTEKEFTAAKAKLFKN